MKKSTFFKRSLFDLKRCLTVSIAYLKEVKGVPPADENGDIVTSDRVGQDESVGTN